MLKINGNIAKKYQLVTILVILVSTLTLSGCAIKISFSQSTVEENTEPVPLPPPLPSDEQKDLADVTRSESAKSTGQPKTQDNIAPPPALPE